MIEVIAVLFIASVFLYGMGSCVAWRLKGIPDPREYRGNDGLRLAHPRTQAPPKRPVVYRKWVDESGDVHTEGSALTPHNRDDLETMYLMADSAKEKKRIARELQSFDKAHDDADFWNREALERNSPDLWAAPPESDKDTDMF